MYAFDTVNYSLRPNKIIQRQIVFDGLELLRPALSLSEAVYIGFGSVWFADFILAHKRLGLVDMISIEEDAVLAARARFNAPFRTVRVEEGNATPVLNDLKDDVSINQRPWIVWLDYVSPLTPEVVRDMDLLTAHAPDNSVVLITVNARASNAGEGVEGRRSALHKMLGDVVAPDAPTPGFSNRNFQKTLASYLTDYLHSRCSRFGRPGGFIPTFQLPYRDGTEMLTIGGVLPAPSSEATIKKAVDTPDWPGFPSEPIETPPLTIKETSALQKLLPAEQSIARSDVQRLGFDLEADKLKVYCAHYRRYPSFFQVVS